MRPGTVQPPGGADPGRTMPGGGWTPPGAEGRSRVDAATPPDTVSGAPPDGPTWPPAADREQAPPGAESGVSEPRGAGARLFLTWLLILSGIGLLLIASLLGAQGSADAALFGLASLLALTVGLLSGAGYQVASRSRRPVQAYRGPAPVLLFLVVVVLTTLAIGILLALGLPNPVDVTGAAVLSVLVTDVAYAVVVWGTVVRTKALSWPQMGWPSWAGPDLRRLMRDALAGIALAVPTYVLTEIGGAILSAVLGVHLSTPVPTPQTPAGWLLLAPAVALFTPIGEELFFRGFALSAWRRDLGERSALIRATLFFALVHVLNVVPTSAVEGLKVALLQFLVIVPVGWVLGLLFLRRGIVASIAGHMAWNSIAIVLLLVSAQAGV